MPSGPAAAVDAARAQLRALLAGDPALASLGYDARTVVEDPHAGGRTLILRWPDAWYGSVSGVVGELTVLLPGVSGRTRDAVLDRVGTVLVSAPAARGPVSRVCRVSADGFRVLAAGGAR